MDNTKIEKEGNYMGYNYVVTFNTLGFRSGYVEVPDNHLLIRNGITTYEGDRFGNGKYYIGFDCRHDLEYVETECRNVILELMDEEWDDKYGWMYQEHC